MESVYIETTIVSYLASKPSRDIQVAAHQQATRDWWEEPRRQFECFISQVVLDEIKEGDAGAVEKRMAVVADLPVLEAPEAAERLAGEILRSGAIPANAVRDAAHIAVAAVHSIDYLLTWNCRHLANAQIMRRVAAVCRAGGLVMPLICTPEELMGE